MCGYCVEAGIILDFIEHEKLSGQVEFENFWVSNYLQESENFPGIIQKLKKFNDFPSSIDIAFCRVWEMFINNEYDTAYKGLEAGLDKESIKKFLIRFYDSDDCKKWGALGDRNLYVDKQYWDRFMENKQPLIDNSIKTLMSYYDWWILGNTKEISDPADRMEKTGIMDPIEDTPPKEWNRFYLFFPAVFFSLSLLSRHQSKSDIIKRIAIETPQNVPDFSGYDLWLQRKAFIVCLKEYGIQFIIDHYDKLRFELISYALLKNAISNKSEFYILEKIISSRDHFEIGLGSDSVLRLINKLRHQQPDR